MTSRECRFCHQYANEEKLVKYGVRHYAHHACYLDHKPLHELHAWQVRSFPFRLLKDRGLLEEAEACGKN